MKIRHPLMLCAAALLAGCAGLLGPRTVDVPLTKMQASLERRFPLHNRALELLDVELTHPQLALQPDQGRVQLTLDASMSPPFSRQSWSGHVVLSGQVALDNARYAVVLRDPHVDQLTIDGGDEGKQRQFVKVVNIAADGLLRDVVLYTFKPEDLRLAGTQFMPTQITETASSLQVRLEPVR